MTHQLHTTEPPEATARSTARQKISRSLTDFAHPVVADIPTDAPLKQFETAYSLAVCAWNTALLQAEGTTVELDKLHAVLAVRYPAHLLSLFDGLLARKHRIFGSDPRHISAFNVSLTTAGPQVEAVSVCSARRLVNDPPPNRAS